MGRNTKSIQANEKTMCEDEPAETTDITIFGSIHVSETSIQEMEETIKEENPEIIAIELGKKRFDSYIESRDSDSTNRPKTIFQAIKSRNTSIRKYAFLRLLWEIQNRVGKSLTDGTTDADMQQAVEIAIETGRPVALIDREIDETMNSYMSKVSIRELSKTISFLLFSILSLPFIDTNNAVKRLNENNNDKNDVLKDVLSILESKAPSLYTSYIEERNIFLADNLSQLRRLDMDTVAVIGKGHVESVQNYIDNEEQLEIEKENYGINGSLVIINDVEEYINKISDNN
jgi:pheromone shutdown protein TraB